MKTIKSKQGALQGRDYLKGIGAATAGFVLTVLAKSTTSDAELSEK